MNTRQINDNELKEFCQWYKGHFRKSVTNEAPLAISMCGYLHILPREAGHYVDRCVELGVCQRQLSKCIKIL